MNAHSPIRIHADLIQGSEEWHQARCGLLTASEFDRIVTPTLKIAANAKERAHCWELAAQRITGHVEAGYVSDAMLRGHEDEIVARQLYSERFAPVEQCGFVTNSTWGFTLGCSPDGLVGDEGMIECKSRGQRFQVQTLCEWFVDRSPPEDFMLQVQGELLVTGRNWCDLISYSGGLPMVTMRIEPDRAVQHAILDAAAKFEARINEIVATFGAAAASDLPLIPTERRVEQEMYI